MSEVYRGIKISWRYNADGDSDYEEWWEVGRQAFDTLEEAKLFIDTVMIH